MKATYPLLEIADVADLSSLYHPLFVLLVPDRRSIFGRLPSSYFGGGQVPFLLEVLERNYRTPLLPSWPDYGEVFLTITKEERVLKKEEPL
jgi:hypothetical protein